MIGTLPMEVPRAPKDPAYDESTMIGINFELSGVWYKPRRVELLLHKSTFPPRMLHIRV